MIFHGNSPVAALVELVLVVVAAAVMAFRVLLQISLLLAHRRQTLCYPPPSFWINGFLF
jgi:hypothetical protein